MTTSPGFAFVEKHGLPTSRGELATCVTDYVTFLRNEAGLSKEPPVDLEAICQRFGLQVHAMAGGGGAAGIDIQGAALREMGCVFVSEEDRQTRRRFSLAHELIEFLVGALSGNQLGRGVDPCVREGEKKELLCNWGAARLLMPYETFAPDLRDYGTTVEGASRLAARYQTSLIASLTRMVRCAKGRLALIVWRRCHRPAERSAVAGANQQALFEEGYRAEPEKKLRVWWSVFGGRHKKSEPVRPYESISSDSIICRALEEDSFLRETEHVALRKLRGKCHIEAKPARIGSEQSVITLLCLPSGFSEPVSKEATLQAKMLSK